MLVVPIWYLSYPETTIRHSAKPFFIYISQLTALTGFSLFALTFVLSARIKWMETWFGGLDKMYHTHHTMANVAFALLLVHPLLLALRWIPEDVPRVFRYLFPMHRRMAVDFGSWSLWGLILLMLLTLVIKLPYDRWKLTHKFLGVAFILGVAHTFFLDELVTSNSLLFGYLLVLSVVGIAAWIYKTIFLEYIVKKPRFRVSQIERLSDRTMEIELETEEEPLQFVPGQFYFFSFRSLGITREAHPYTICSAPGENKIRIMVKALGDYTHELYRNLKPGATAFLEGPYGHFDYTQEGGGQVWIGGGVGIAPFISWMRNIEKEPSSDITADLYYCVNTQKEATHLEEFKELEHQLSGFSVHLVCADREGYLDARDIPGIEKKKIYICGPKEMRQKLVREFQELNISGKNIHYEDFDFF